LLIIGLVGASREAQQSILLQLHKLLDVYGVFSVIPDVSDELRLNCLRQMFNPGKVRARRVLIGNIKTLAELAWLESRNAYICHCDGTMSRTIPIKPGHYLITDRSEPNRNFQPCDEIFSQILVHYKQSGRARRKDGR
jgi:hypothetical protein